MHSVADSRSIQQAHSNKTRAQKSSGRAYYRIGVSTQSTLRGAQRCNNAPITSFIYEGQVFSLKSIFW